VFKSVLYHRAHPQHNSKQSTHLAMSNNMRTIFSASPRHLEDRVEADTLKNVVLHSAATAFASIVLPVEGSQAVLLKGGNVVKIIILARRNTGVAA
jgi:hypothetical protein